MAQFLFFHTPVGKTLFNFI